MSGPRWLGRPQHGLAEALVALFERDFVLVHIEVDDGAGEIEVARDVDVAAADVQDVVAARLLGGGQIMRSHSSMASKKRPILKIPPRRISALLA